MIVSSPSKKRLADAGQKPVALRPLLWLNLVCLDAPVVAVTWQWFFARNYRIALPWGSREALFFTAWFIYLVDRYADSVSLRLDAPKSVRQQFWSRHYWIWPAVVGVVGLSDAGIIFLRLNQALIWAGACVGLIAGAYLVLNHACNRFWNALPAKEITIGFLFAAGTVLVPALSTKSLFWVVPGVLFACLCSLNCMSIAFWERDLDQVQGKYSIATHWPGGRIYVRLGLIAVSCGAVLFAFLHRDLWPLCACLALSGFLLFLLHSVPVPQDERSALADLVLLTPLLFIGKMW